MGRPSKFTEDEILDAALAVVARVGSGVTTAEVAARAGARVGSLYYRFPNREVMLLALWVRSVKRFQVEFLAAARSVADPGAALVAAAVAIPRYCRRFPEQAQALTLFRHAEVLERLDGDDPDLADCPEPLAAEVRSLNDEVMVVLTDLTVRRFGNPGRLELVRLAVQQTPYGLVRRFIGSDADPMPDWLEEVVAAMVAAALSQGDGG